MGAFTLHVRTITVSHIQQVVAIVGDVGNAG